MSNFYLQPFVLLAFLPQVSDAPALGCPREVKRDPSYFSSFALCPVMKLIRLSFVPSVVVRGQNGHSDQFVAM